MEPIGLLTGLAVGVAEGAGGELSRQVWAGLRLLVRRCTRRGETEARSADEALAALERNPRSDAHAANLVEALWSLMQVDPELNAAAEAWVSRATAVARTGDRGHSPVPGYLAEEGCRGFERIRPFVPDQLPASAAYFSNRVEELGQLNKMVGSEREGSCPALAVVSGPEGLGKTELAKRWLREQAAHYPDGLLYADLTRHAGGDPAQLRLVIAGFLRALGVPGEHVPDQAEDAASFFRALTARMRLGILLDDAVSAAQVQALLPSSPVSTVVATSRYRLMELTVHGAHFIHLEPLEQQAAAALLRRALGPRPVEDAAWITALSEACGGHPMALSLLAGLLATRPQSLVYAARRLMAVADVPAGAFGVSYVEMSAAQRVAYRRLSLHPGGEFSLAAAAAAIDAPAGDARALVESLAEIHVLEESARGRYRFHAIAQQEGVRRAKEEDPVTVREAAMRRLLEHYLNFAAQADAVVSPQEWRLGSAFPPDDAPPAYASTLEALEALEGELPNMMAVLAAGRDQGARELVWQLAEAMWQLFLRRRHFEQWEAAYRLGIEAAIGCGNDAALSRMYHHLGFGLHRMGRFDEALAAGAAAREAACEADCVQSEAEALGLLGMTHRSMGDPATALPILERAVTLERQAGSKRGESLGRRRVGQALIEVRRFDEAIEELTQSVDLAYELGDHDARAMSMAWLADAHTRAGHPEDGEPIAREAAGILDESGSSDYKAKAYMVWAEAAEARGHEPGAYAHFTRSRALFIEAGARSTKRVDAGLARLAGGTST